MTIDLNKHLAQKLANHAWVTSMAAGDTSAFPYTPANSSIARTSTEHLSPPHITFSSANFETGKPLHAICIPMRHPYNSTATPAKLYHLLKRIQEEAFGETPEISRELVKKRLAVVVGINQFRSIDNQTNIRFKKMIYGLGSAPDIPHKVIGFFLNTVWSRKIGMPANTYPAEKAFRLFRALINNPSQAEAARQMIEEESGSPRSQLSMSEIRNHLLVSAETRQAIAMMPPESPAYYTIMDDDTKALRIAPFPGTFSRIEHAIESHHPSTISTSYLVHEPEHPVVHVAVVLDAAVRNAMGRFAYSTEALFSIRLPTDRTRLRHLRAEGPTLEARRMIQNGKRHGIIDSSHQTIPHGIYTTTPARFTASAKARRTTLSTSDVKQKQILQAFRGAPQSHLQPLFWADNVLAELQFSSPNYGILRGHVSNIYKACDPISIMFARPGRYTKSTFDDVANNYESHIQTPLLNTARGHLSLLGMSKDQIDTIEALAKASGKALNLGLKHYAGIS